MRTLSEDIDALGKALGTVLREQAGDDFFELEERIRVETKTRRERGESTAPLQQLIEGLGVDDATGIVRAFSVYFQLVNLAEEYERVRQLASRSGPRKQGFEQAFASLQEAGHDAKSVRALIESVQLGLTFTAHPTEMRRRTVRAHLEAIAHALPQLGEADVRERITAHIEALWNTLELRRTRPTVADEVTAGLTYIEVIASVLADLERDLERAFDNVFGERARLPLPLTFHSWMGGDRDGNPQVTAQVTRETFERHHDRARSMLEAAVREMFAFLSQHRDRLRDAEGQAEEPFRALSSQLQQVAERPAADGAELLALAESVRDALEREGQLRSADAFGRELVVRARAFGLHLASLDVREHSSAIGAAVAEMLKSAGIDDYAELDEPAKQKCLLRELSTRRPLLAVHAERSDEVDNVLSPVLVVAEAIRTVGARAFGRYVVSMSEAPSDVLEVLVLAREAGVRIKPVPLFETLADLHHAPRVMEALLQMAPYRAAHDDGEPIEVMIGYSDSNKDAGFFAASWALYSAQRSVTDVCRRAKVAHRFFHGRGTSIGRGGGPMARAFLGQPAGTLEHGLRITEQGEALQDKYSLPELAYRNLEQGLFGLLTAAGRPERALPEEIQAAMDQAAEASVKAYRELVEDPEFLPFFEAVTPIGEIANLRIASRPVRRPGAATLQNLRAIPWVMSWTQCRANVPGWYGLDRALASLGTARARELYGKWSFFRSMLDNAQMSLGKVDLEVFEAYLQLAPNAALGKQILEHYRATVDRVCDVLEGKLLCHEPHLARSIALRNPYIEPIHRVQVELLRRRRAQGDAEDAPLERALLLSIQGIAAGMRNTG